MSPQPGELPVVYIAGPIASDPLGGTRRAIQVGMQLWRERIGVPVIPHLSILTELVEPMSVEEWYEMDLHLLARCHVLLRLPGESKGADLEAAYARKHGIDVVPCGGIVELTDPLAVYRVWYARRWPQSQKRDES